MRLNAAAPTAEHDVRQVSTATPPAGVEACAARRSSGKPARHGLGITIAGLGCRDNA